MTLRTVSVMRRKAYKYIELARKTGRWDILDAMVRGKITPKEALEKLEKLASSRARTSRRKH